MAFGDGGSNMTLAKSWRIQRRTIWALILREMLTRYGRHNIGFLWLFVEPMLFTLGVTALWTATKSVHGSDLPIVAFAITGYSSVLLWRNMPGRCIGAIAPNLSLLYHRNVRPIDIYLSRLILEAAGVTMSFVFLTFVFQLHRLARAAGGRSEDGRWVAHAGLVRVWPLPVPGRFVRRHPKRLRNSGILPPTFTFPLSGAAFLVDALPQAAQKIRAAAAHGPWRRISCARVISVPQITAHYDMAYMAL